MLIQREPLTARLVAVERRRRAHARVLCHFHAAPLLAMASMILDDAELAEDIVAATLAAACRPVQHPQPSSAATRLTLARSVYWRCVDSTGATPYRPRSSRRPADPRALPLPQRAVMALLLFGGHDIRQTGVTLHLPIQLVVHCVLEAMSSGAPRQRRRSPNSPGDRSAVLHAAPVNGGRWADAGPGRAGHNAPPSISDCSP